MIDWKEEMKTFVITVRVRYIQYQTVFIDYLCILYLLYLYPCVTVPAEGLMKCLTRRKGGDVRS